MQGKPQRLKPQAFLYSFGTSGTRALPDGVA